jgi:hypothetical protein
MRFASFGNFMSEMFVMFWVGFSCTWMISASLTSFDGAQDDNAEIVALGEIKSSPG